jgi:adenylate cyclase
MHEATTQPSQRWFSRIANVGISQTDDADTRVRKRVLTITALITAIAVTPWTIFYFAIGIPQAAIIPTFYIVTTVVLLVRFSQTHDDRAVRLAQLVLFLVLPPLVHIALGGFANSSAVVIYSVVVPIGALSFADVAHPWRWFGGFAFIVAVLVPLDSTFQQWAPEVPAGVVTSFFAANILTTAFISVLALASYVRSRDRLAAELTLEKAKSDRLLLNVLPGPIAERLKAGERPIADRHDHVGVLFGDIVDFTALSETLTADELVGDLNRLFGGFDALAAKHGVEKIKTIGDAYMAISGAPGTAPGLTSLVELALEMRDAAMGADLGTRQGIVMRFGIDVGPLVAGVIGESRFIYDVYGDTVNTASRMESTGLPGKIQVTDSVAAELDGRYRLDDRGTIEIKGKGPTRTWLLERIG